LREDTYEEIPSLFCPFIQAQWLLQRARRAAPREKRGRENSVKIRRFSLIFTKLVHQRLKCGFGLTPNIVLHSEHFDLVGEWFSQICLWKFQRSALCSFGRLSDGRRHQIEDSPYYIFSKIQGTLFSCLGTVI
jgi:hypothetical protein